MFPVFTVVSGQLVLIDGVHEDDIPKCLTKPLLTVVVDAVAHHRFPLVVQDRAFHQPCLVILCIIIALFRIDMAVTRSNIRRTDDMGNRMGVIVIKRVGSQVELR